MTRPEVLVFDVNETLLDLGHLRSRFAEALGHADLIGEWFARMLHGSLVANHLGAHRSFGLIGAETLMTVAQKRGIPLDPAVAAALVEGMRALPAHPDVAGALDRLAEAGFRLVALTNGSADTVADQLSNAGIADRFERAMSVDAVGRFKPAPEVYLHAAAVLDVDIDRMLMVAAHDWDVLGARSVGMPGAFLARPGVVWGMPDEPPGIVAHDLAGAADQIIAAWPAGPRSGG
jgi:2-haloacid dehalogenase